MQHPNLFLYRNALIRMTTYGSRYFFQFNSLSAKLARVFVSFLKEDTLQWVVSCRFYSPLLIICINSQPNQRLSMDPKLEPG